VIPADNVAADPPAPDGGLLGWLMGGYLALILAGFLVFKFAPVTATGHEMSGIRDASDLRYEFQLALANRAVGGVETVFIMTGDQHALTSSSLIRQVVALGVDVRQLSSLLPPVVIERLKEKQRKHVLEPAEPDAPAN